MRVVTRSALLVVALAACSPSSDTTTTGPTTTTVAETTTSSAAPTTSLAPTTTTSAKTTTTTAQVDVIVTGGVADGPDRFEVEMGDLVRIIVLADVADEVHVHGFDLTFPVEPGVPTLVTFTPDAQGIFEVELEESEIPLFELVVAP